MAQYAERARDAFLQTQKGRTEKVLIETRNKNGMYEGYTPNYTLVYLKADESFVNKIVDVRLTEVSGDHMIGELEMN